jgi:hypothetical protein
LTLVLDKTNGGGIRMLGMSLRISPSKEGDECP